MFLKHLAAFGALGPGRLGVVWSNVGRDGDALAWLGQDRVLFCLQVVVKGLDEQAGSGTREGLAISSWVRATSTLISHRQQIQGSQQADMDS